MHQIDRSHSRQAFWIKLFSGIKKGSIPTAENFFMVAFECVVL